MKFGGTSVASPEDLKRAAARIVDARERGKKVVAVLSARGKTTDDLVAAAYEISDRPLAREMDMLLSTGERISCALCAMAIHDMGHSAISLTGSQAGIVTDSSHTKARILDVRADRIQGALTEDRIVLVAGFQGVSGDSKDVTTLGRGGSDTTAVALAAALDAEVCEIYTDVAGVFSADPRIVPGARKLTHVSFDEMLEMSSSGAGVLQLRAVEYARNHGVRIHCRSSFEDAPGTLVARRRRDDGAADGHSRNARLRGARDPDRPPRRARRRRRGLQRPRRRQRQRRHDHPERAGLGRSEGGPLVHGRQGRPQQATDVLAPVEAGDGIETDPEVGKVSIVGAGMRSHPGVAAKVFKTLGEQRDQHRDDLDVADQDFMRDRRRAGARGGDGDPRGVRASAPTRSARRTPTGEHRPRVRPGEDGDEQAA